MKTRMKKLRSLLTTITPSAAPKKKAKIEVKHEKSFKLKKTIKTGTKLYSLAYIHPDTIITEGENKSFISFVNINTGKIKKVDIKKWKLTRGLWSIRKISHSLVALSGWDKKIFLMNYITFHPLDKYISGWNSNINAIVKGKNCSRILSCTGNGQIIEWDISGKWDLLFKSTEGSLYDLCVSDDGSYVVAVGQTMVIFDYKRKKSLNVKGKELSRNRWGVCFINNYKFAIADYSQSGCEIWNARTRSLVKKIQLPRCNPYRLIFVKKYLIFGSKQILVYDVEREKFENYTFRTLNGSSCCDLVVDYEGKIIFVEEFSGDLNILDTKYKPGFFKSVEKSIKLLSESNKKFFDIVIECKRE